MTETHAHKLERTVGDASRKATNHSLHALHPYKGKFYPQLARALLNLCEVPDGGLVVDPFAGCGTTVIEAATSGLQAIGVDSNPVAVLVGRTKLRLLTYPASRLESEFARLRPRRAAVRLAQADYLETWFPPRNLDYLQRILPAIEAMSSPIAAAAAKVVLSSCLRKASLQDPRQLRVFRRKTGRSADLQTLFEDSLVDLVAEIRALQAIKKDVALRPNGSRFVEGDARCLATIVSHFRRAADAVITSPPYATALPYIDTDRLSLRAFGLGSQGSQRLAEQLQIGNREITDASRRQLEAELATAASRKWMPRKLSEIIQDATEVADRQESGFRRKRTPALLFKYFRDMDLVLSQISMTVKYGGAVAMVVGDNVIEGEDGRSRVPTTDILVALAERHKLRLLRDISKSLTSWGAPDTVHQRNAMSAERILLFRVDSRSR